MNEKFLNVMVQMKKFQLKILKENVQYCHLNIILLVSHYFYSFEIFFFFSIKILILFLGRLTEIPENDVYVCESKYIADDHSLRSLTKGLKVKI
jgi:hypothetical protein